MSRSKKCGRCNGSGVINTAPDVVCPDCGGSGKVKADAKPAA